MVSSGEDLALEERLKDRRLDQLQFHADTELIRIQDRSIQLGEEIPRYLLPVLCLRKDRARTLTRRVHKLFCALAGARWHRKDAGGWLTLGDVMQLEGWERDTPRRLTNELDLGAGDLGIVEPRGKGSGTQLRLRMPPELITTGHLPDDVLGLFEAEQLVAPTDVRPDAVRELRFATLLADALRTAPLLEIDPDGRIIDDERTLLISPLYQGGERSLVFGGLAARPADNLAEEPPTTSVLVKIAIDPTTGRPVQDSALDAELALLQRLAGLPGLPSRVAKRMISVGPLDRALRRHGVALDDVAASDRIAMLIIDLGHPRTVEAAPRLLSTVINDTTAPMRRRTRRDLHNVLILAEQLAMLTRSLHLERRAHRHLSVQAIVVRYEVGILERVLAADLSASVAVRSGRADLLYRDLFDLGSVLVHAISSVPLIGDRVDFQPPDFPGRALIKRAVEGEGETVYRLLFAISRYLLEPSPTMAHAGQPAPTVRLLDHFLDELAHIQTLHWSRARGVPERRVPPSDGGGVAPPSHAARETLARSASDPIATRLLATSHAVRLETLFAWCRSYVIDWWRASIDSSTAGDAGPDAVPLAAERCISILRQGYGRSAAAAMWKYLWQTEDPDPNDVMRVLRNYVTHWIREGRYDVPHELEPDVTWSQGLADELERLKRRFADLLVRGPDARPTGDWTKVEDWIVALQYRTSGNGALPSQRSVKDKQLLSWMHAATLREQLRVPQRPPTERDIYEVENALRGRNSPETVFWHILLARAWVSAAIHGSVKSPDTETGWDKAMRSLLVAAGVAAGRQLPYEMAGALAASAHLTRIALSTPRLRAELTQQGADEDSVRVQAAECALTAADAYLWLDNPRRHYRSLLEAALLLQGSPFPERLIQSFQLLSLARNNRSLPWQPLQDPDESLRDASPTDDFVRYPKIAGDTVRFTSAEQALFDELHMVWGRTRGRIQASDDPGTALEHGWFSRYTASVPSVLAPDAPPIEARPRGAAARETAVRRLLRYAPVTVVREAHAAAPSATAPPRLRILDFGCGAGEDAWDLAADHDVWGVDSPVWLAATRQRSAPAGSAAPTFLPFDPVDYARRVLQDNQPEDSPTIVDAVLFRYSLGRVSRRDELLRAAHKLLRTGGVVLATDWIQVRTTDRITWSRLLHTLRVVDLETEAGYQGLSAQLDNGVGFTGFRSWSWDQVRASDEPSLHQLMHDRLEATRRKLAAEDMENPLSPYARAALLQAQRDLEVLEAMTTAGGPLGWLFWAAEKLHA